MVYSWCVWVSVLWSVSVCMSISKKTEKHYSHSLTLPPSLPPSLPQSQKQLYNDFVLLREKYDEAKLNIAEVLWGYLPSTTSSFPSIPPMQQLLQPSFDPSIPPSLPPSPLVENEQQVGPYSLGPKLGEGQFAKVFSCRKRREGGREGGVEYALKVINKEKMASLGALRRVDSEIGAQRTLRHRGILRVHDVINGRCGLYVVMEKGGKGKEGGREGGTARVCVFCFRRF